MAISLADFRTLVGDDAVTYNVINTLREESPVLDRIQFDFAQAPAGGGAMAYAWPKVDTQATAGTRAINSNFTAQEANSEWETVVLKIVGGAFGVDRIFGEGFGPAVSFQVEQKARAVSNEFQRLFINGDSGVDANSFDGIRKTIVGSAQEIDDAVSLLGVDTAAEAWAIQSKLDELLASLNSTRNAALLVNSRTKILLQNVGRVSGAVESGVDGFGRPVSMYNGIPILDMGLGNAEGEVIGINTGVTSIYAVHFDAFDGVHAVAPAGSAPVRTYLPNPDASNGESVLKGTLEMVTALAIRHPRAVAALTNVTVSA